MNIGDDKSEVDVIIDSSSITLNNNESSNNNTNIGDVLKFESGLYNSFECELINQVFNSVPIMMGVCDLYDNSNSDFQIQDSQNYDFKFVISNRC